jgi:hypothetical protein
MLSGELHPKRKDNSQESELPSPVGEGLRERPVMKFQFFTSG